MTAATGAPVPVGDPFGYQTAESPRVIYRAANQHIIELTVDPSGTKWNASDLTLASKAPPVVGDPAAFVAGVARVAYRCGAQALCESFWNPTLTSWETRSLPTTRGPDIKGFADLHTHQFGHLGFGGWAIAGEAHGPAATALQWCDRQQQHGAGGKNDIIGNLVRSMLTGESSVGHVVGGYPKFDGWPAATALTHQMMWEEWLRRAHLGGLQLIVMHAVNSEHFCKHAHIRTGRTCSDQEAISVQIEAAKQMERDIDSISGGIGKGWYRIVYAPWEARLAIEKGQLAVVLGAEVDTPVPCVGACDVAALQWLDVYYRLGIRHMFPIHFMNNALGGASFDKSLQVERLTGAITFSLGVVDELLHPYLMDLRSCSEYRREGGKCNALGLTHAGSTFLRGVISKGMLYEVDHMSELASNTAMDIAEAVGYPIVSGHTGFAELARTAPSPEKSHEGNLNPARLERIRRSGGIVAPILNQGRLDEISTFMDGPVVVPHSCPKSSATFAQAYLYATTKAPGIPVGFASDGNTFFDSLGPRTAGCGGTLNGVSYPFTALANGRTFGLSKAVENDPQVTRTFDFKKDGFAHIGMYPDLVEDLRILGISDEALKPLMSSAEGYIQVWEKSIEHQTAEEVACSALRQDELRADGAINNLQKQLRALGQRQKDCQAGRGEFERQGGRKPKECVDQDDKEVRKLLNAQLSQAGARLKVARASKSEFGCWY